MALLRKSFFLLAKSMISLVIHGYNLPLLIFTFGTFDSTIDIMPFFKLAQADSTSGDESTIFSRSSVSICLVISTKSTFFQQYAWIGNTFGSFVGLLSSKLSAT